MPFPFSPHSVSSARTPPLSKQVLHHLRQQLVRAEMPADSPISEAKYASALGVSRVPVREALMQVHRDGLVYLISTGHRAKSLVRSFTSSDVRQISSLRREIEGLAARSAAVFASARDLALMEENIAGFDAASSPEELAHWDVEFHRLLCASSHQEWILSTWEMIRWPFEAILVRGFRAYVEATSFPESKVSTDDHFRILGAIRARDAAAAECLLRQHISRWEEWSADPSVAPQPALADASGA